MAVTLALMLAGAQLPAVAAASETAVPTRTDAASWQQRPGSFSALIKEVKPAVVNIATTGGSAMPGGMQGFEFNMPELPEGSPFGDFFRHFFENMPQSPQGGEGFEVRGAGSGFIISEDGYIVTNHHVIDDADKIEAVMNDGTRYVATVKGIDSKTDIALLKIDADEPLPYVSFGDSDAAEIGDWVVAVGNQFGLGGSATAGIISARGRDIQAGPFDDFLQIDAPINRGNSGGPLFDTGGKVIGINTAIFSPSGGNVGIGFAIPSNMAKDIVAELRNSGAVTRGWLGVEIQPVTAEIAESLGLDKAQGALVANVVKDSPASRSGFKVGDVILQMDGKSVKEFKDLPRLVASTRVGSESVFDIHRGGEEQQLEVVIGAMPGEDTKLARVDSSDDSKADSAKLGLQLASLNAENRKLYKIGRDSNGVLVAGVERNSPASKAGIRPGAVINMVGQNAVASPDDVITQVRQAAEQKKSAVLLRVEYRGQNRFVAVKLATA